METKRKHSDLIELLRTSLKGGGRRKGIAELVSQAIAKDLDILINEEVRPVYLANPDFAKFLTEYIEGLPKWLD